MAYLGESSKGYENREGCRERHDNAAHSSESNASARPNFERACNLESTFCILENRGKEREREREYVFSSLEERRQSCCHFLVSFSAMMRELVRDGTKDGAAEETEDEAEAEAED